MGIAVDKDMVAVHGVPPSPLTIIVANLDLIIASKEGGQPPQGPPRVRIELNVQAVAAARSIPVTLRRFGTRP